MQQQKQAMEQATKGTGVAVTQTADNQLKLEIPSDISFDTGRSDIRPNFAPILDRFAGSLRDHAATTVSIVGHTDSTGSDAINDPLSVNRAASTRDYLAARGVATNRISISGMGERQPIADNTSDAGRAPKNRRVEIFVTGLRLRRSRRRDQRPHPQAPSPTDPFVIRRMGGAQRNPSLRYRHQRDDGLRCAPPILQILIRYASPESAFSAA